MKRPPTPNHGGSYRVIDGQLVAASDVLVADPVLRQGGPGIPVPDADAPNPPASTPRPPRKPGKPQGGRSDL